MGLSGCGHGLFEDAVETAYKSGSLYDPETVKNHLMNKSYLQSATTIEDILRNNAVNASSYCECNLTSCDCSKVVRDTNAMKDLVNLAIASTVIVIRKGFTEWLQANPPTIFLFSPIVNKSFSPTRHYDSWKGYYDSWNPGVITAYSVGESPGQISGAVSFQMNRHLYNLKISAGDYVDKIITRNQFDAQNLKSSNYYRNFSPTKKMEIIDASEVGIGMWKEYPGVGEKYPGMPSIGPAPIRFRLPKLEEIQNDEQWRIYLTARDKFYKTQQLYDVSKSLFALENRLQESKDEEEKSLIKETIANLRKSNVWEFKD